MRGIVQYYRKLLRGGDKDSETTGLESFEGEQDADELVQRVDVSRLSLRRIVKEYLDDDPALIAIADALAIDGQAALEALAADDEEALAESAEMRGALEVIVRTDGSRPSFMLRDGVIDRNSSPVGSWKDDLDEIESQLIAASEAVGRVDDPSSAQGFRGTAFLVAENLVMTNRHVVETLVERTDPRKPRPDIRIDFGHEFRARASVRPRRPRRVVFATADAIGSSVDHRKVDLALVELFPPDSGGTPPGVLSVDISTEWPGYDTTVLAMGYPGEASHLDRLSLVELLFRSTFGVKRLSIGRITRVAGLNTSAPWYAAHDATTLGGSSGSVVVTKGRAHMAAGLHYGGRRDDPAENWCHVIGMLLDQRDAVTNLTLQEVFDAHGVHLVDPFAWPSQPLVGGIDVE